MQIHLDKDTDSRSYEDPWSESHAVNRITEDRAELYDVLRSMSDDPRVSRFLLEYDANYQMLIISNNNRLSLRDSVRELRAQGKVSGAKSVVVEDIYRASDEHISHMRRDINVVYHQLIEMQEAEDAIKKVLAELTKDIADLNAMIMERQRGIPAHQLRIKDRMETKWEDVKGEKDKMVAELERLRDEFSEAAIQQAQLEKGRLEIEEKIAETQREFVRVNNDITKENLKKGKIKAALQAGEEQYENRERDMEDLQNQVTLTKEQCVSITEAIHATTVKSEKLKISVNMMAGKIRNKQYEYEELMHVVNQIEAEASVRNAEIRKKTHELEVIREQSLQVDKERLALKNKVNEVEEWKEATIQRKEEEKQRNLKLSEEVTNTKRKMESDIKAFTDLIKQRDCLRKALMKEKTCMQKDHMFLALHQLANKRLTHDNMCLVLQAKDQRTMINKLENERDSYIKQAVQITRKVVQKADEERRTLESIFGLMKLIASEEIKMLETQNLYEATRNEHVLYTRHILQLKDTISRLKAKATSMTYETQKLLQERDYRDECLVQEELALQKLNRQIFILKANLRDLKESNARMKMIIDNQDLEEKDMIKMVRVMRIEKIRESKGMERVIRDIDGLDLALTRRHHELHDLYKMVKLRQSLLEKGENMYNVRWKEYVHVKSSLARAKAFRRLDCKNRAIADQLMDCVKLMKDHLEYVRLRSKGLMEELSHPRNIHRWRNILARDPEAYASVRNLHKIRNAIQLKVEHTASTLGQIQLMDRHYISLTTTVLMQPSPETVLQLKLYQEELHTRFKQIKKLTAELREALDNKTDMTARSAAIHRKMKKIRELWIHHMTKVTRRKSIKGLESSGPLPLLPGPEGVPKEVETLQKQITALCHPAYPLEDTPPAPSEPPPST